MWSLGGSPTGKCQTDTAFDPAALLRTARPRYLNRSSLLNAYLKALCLRATPWQIRLASAGRSSLSGKIASGSVCTAQRVVHATGARRVEHAVKVVGHQRQMA